jgi:2-polyprenyl-6-methoxyphenol hydroxylase-like FAD-dependent oxidoreductase
MQERLNVNKSILIVGGGTAGWMAANLLAKSWQDTDIKVTLIESADIGIIGVGEGSTPQLKGFMDYIGAQESDWMPKCNATYKNGITFKNWSSKPGFSQYFHPFPAQTDDYTAPAFFYNSFVRRKGIDIQAHPDPFFLASYLAKNKLAPIANDNFPFETNYGYHFDSNLLGKYLSEKAGTFGVKHLVGTVESICSHENGDIKSVVTQDGEEICADIFIDCSGFQSLLIQKHLKTPFISFADNLFNDSAVVIATEKQDEIESQTISTAMKHGWAWEIPLLNRTGNGYVYSSSFCSADEAEAELKEKLGLQDSAVTVRHLKMKVGRVKDHWVKNCIAVGLSQGFIEPLEATALHLVQETIQGFIDNYQDGDFSQQYQQRFNNSINQRFDAVRDYIVAHYRVNSRNDTPYWRANAQNNNVSPSLANILNIWVNGKNLSDELDRQKIDNFYPSVSWHCLLAGYGIYPNQEQLKPGNHEAHKHDLDKISDFIKRCALNYQPHREFLEKN